MNPTTKSCMLLLALSLTTVPLAGCSKAPPTRPAPDPTPAVNPMKPNANPRIQAQSSFGVATHRSSISQISGPDPTGCAFRGLHDGYAVVGRLGAAGDLRWSTRLPYSLRDVLALPSTAPMAGGALVIGSHDSDGDGASDAGYAWVVTASGSMVETEVFSSDTSDVWLNSAAALSDTEFVVVGGERTALRANPFLARVVLTGAGQLETRSRVVLTAMPNVRFTIVVPDPAGPGGGRLALFLTTSPDVGVNTALSVHRVTVDYPSLLAPTIEWSRDIAAAGPSCSANDLRVSGDQLYVCGGTDDAAKPPPSNGGLWRSGLAARLTLAGDVVWTRVVRLSEWSEDLDFIVPTPDGVCLLGNGARFTIVGTGELFGYGWIAKLALGTGDVLANFTVGHEAHASGLHSGHYENGLIHCGGWSHHEMDGGNYQAWYCEIDVTGTMQSATPMGGTPASPAGRPGSLPHPPDPHR